VIIVVDLETLQVLDHFQVIPRKPSFFGTHYSDLSWYDGRLYVLCRQHRVILEVDPESKKITAEFDYTEIEDQLGYMTQLPVGVMEGLAVTRETFWLATDNNGMPRLSAPKDTRPSVVKVPRPDRAKSLTERNKGNKDD
jgi:glutamine cyclotransferase